MANRSQKAQYIALALRTGRWRKAEIHDRLLRTFPDGVDSAKLSARLIFHFDGESAPTINQLKNFLLEQDILQRFLCDPDQEVRNFVLDSPVMARPPRNMAALPLPKLPTSKDLCFWLGIFDNELQWLADCHGIQGASNIQKTHHYRYAWIAKSSGLPRLIEKPKSRTKEIQRQILQDILNKIPPHDSAHGFTGGRSTKSYVSPHVGQQALLRFDLKDFFASVPAAKVAGIFRAFGYPPGVARLLTGLCTNAVAPVLAGETFRQLPWATQKQFRGKHLPQGAPTSPALANFSAWHLDCRLSGLAKSFGLSYTRYADDMAFSGKSYLGRLAPLVESLVGAIAIEEGFRLNHRKTRLRLSSQRQSLAGIVVNTTTNCGRKDFDRLKAILHNCVKFGPVSQNREEHPEFKSHLMGRIANVAWLNPSKGDKLRRIWRKIDWDRSC